MTESSSISAPKDFLLKLSHGGFAETARDKYMDIHINTVLDEYLLSAIDDGKQVVLTGNPGDGKTHHILRVTSTLSGSADPDLFTITDASEEDDYRPTLEEWDSHYQEGNPGLLAINDGPLQEMTSNYSNEYPFLKTVQSQFHNQIILDEAEIEGIDFDDIVVIDLNNRNVLKRKITKQAIEHLTDERFIKGHSHSDICHIQHNVKKLQQEEIQESIKSILKTIGKADQHVTVRDLLNFLGYMITGGTDCETDFDSSLKYYNNAYQGNGELFELLRTELPPRQVPHPFIDSKLWNKAEKSVKVTEDEPEDDRFEKVDSEYIELKRRFLFEADAMETGYSNEDIYKKINHDFLQFRNGTMDSRTGLERTIERANRYFMPKSNRQSELRLWFKHSFNAKASKALVSRNRISKHNLEYRTLQANPIVREALDEPDIGHYTLEYSLKDQQVRLDIDRQLHNALETSEIGIPYIMRDKTEEEQLLRFMREIEYREVYSESEDIVMVKDTSDGDTMSIRVSDDYYELDVN